MRTGIDEVDDAAEPAALASVAMIFAADAMVLAAAVL